MEKQTDMDHLWVVRKSTTKRYHSRSDTCKTETEHYVCTSTILIYTRAPLNPVKSIPLRKDSFIES
jgi:hypothetical protein